MINLEPHWTAYLSAWSTPIIGLLGVLIAYQQWRTAKNKVKLDLYDKRFAIYKSSLVFYQQIMASTNESVKDKEFQSSQKDFIKASREARYLFAKKSGVFQLLEEWHLRSFKVIGFKEVNRDIVNSYEDFDKMRKECDDALKFFEQSLVKLERKLTPYLSGPG